MAVDPRKLLKSQLVRLLNSTPLGEVVTDHRMNKIRQKAGYRIGEGKHIDLVRLVAWLTGERHLQQPDEDDQYEKQKKRSRERQSKIADAYRDIGEIPFDKINWERRNAAERCFRTFCETYFAAPFFRGWSEDHLKVIAKIEQVTLDGGLLAHAMPRGSGKTTLTEAACVWSPLYGHRRFVVLIGAAADKARGLLTTIKTWLETNELLANDFPEVIYPIHKLGRIANRQKGQTYNGEPTRIEWTADKIVFPTIEGSKASGHILICTGMKGSDIRGQNHTLADGSVIRPDLAILDDPQTRESAISPMQCQQREAILNGDVLGMAGPGEKIASIVCCTVIRPDDMADRILDREKNPLWQGERTKMLYEFPTDMELWERYFELLDEGHRNGEGAKAACDFYAKNQAAMDKGAIAAWEDRKNGDELSAIQHAMNLLHERGEEAFWAEFQNEPLPEDYGEKQDLTADEIAEKINQLPRGTVPMGCEHITAFIDVQGDLLYYAVTAWSDDFTGAVVDYGTFPGQKVPFFTLANAKARLSTLFPKHGEEARIHAGLTSLCDSLLGKDWQREDGVLMRIERCQVDAGYLADTVRQFCRTANHAAILTPSFGRAVTAGNVPLNEYQRRPGERVGLNWRITQPQGGRHIGRHVLFDANFWKSFVHARLAVAIGDEGCLSLFGRRPDAHRMISEHLTAEYRVETEGRGRIVDEWKIRPKHYDNHLLDCVVGATVAASIMGCSLYGDTISVKREKVKFSDRQKEARRKRS